MKVNKTLHTLSCGLLLSTLLLSCAAFAFWQVQGSGIDNASAAAFAVSAWMDRQTLYVSNSEGGRGSEVALRYSVELSLSEPLPEGVDVYFTTHARFGSAAISASSRTRASCPPGAQR